MDIQMPGGGGAARVIEQIMARTPVPIVVVSARARTDQTLPFEAVSRGALEVAGQPALPADAAALRARGAAGGRHPRDPAQCARLRATGRRCRRC
jgi:chemotaxis response regulator CheB